MLTCCILRPLDKIQIVLGFRGGKIRIVNVDCTDGSHHIGKVCDGYVHAKGGVDGCHKLGICLIRCKAAYQLIHKACVKGMVIQGQIEQYLCFRYPGAGVAGCIHSGFNLQHGIVCVLQLLNSFRVQLLHYHLTEILNLKVLYAVKECQYGKKRDKENDDDA